MPSMKKKVLFEDYGFLVEENVYEPAEDSFLFAENLPTRRIERAIDVGCGCGILSTVAARNAQEVVALDVNPFAVHCAEYNARLNHVLDKMLLLRGDLFQPIACHAKFDLILFNAPYLPLKAESDSWLTWSWSGGRTGRDVIDRFIKDAPQHLAQDGEILLMQSSLSNVNETLQEFNRAGLAVKLMASQDLPFFERIVLICARWQRE